MRKRIGVILGMIVLAAASRLLPHPPNLTPLEAMALFGGAVLADRRLAFLLPLGAMFLSDLVLGLHPLMLVVYGCFALTVLIGGTLRARRSVARIAGAALASSLLFFLVTNFAVWATSSWYAKDLRGLETCFVAAIPFFRNSLLGDAIYVPILFGGFAWAERQFPALREAMDRRQKGL